MLSYENGMLLAGARAGDARAWSALVDRYGRVVWSIARLFRLDEAVASDVYQETWLRLAANLDRIREPSRLGSWLTTTAKNEALKAIERARRETPVPADDRLWASAPEPDPVADRAISNDRSAAVHQELVRLPHRDRVVVELMVIDGLPYTAVANRLGMPVGSLGPTRGRSLATLRRRLRQRGFD
ncbi:MAG: RNA polymerase sigma factor [Acidimicrobiales bacterium]